MWNFWNKNFGDLLIKGKYWSKNTYDDNFDKFYDYPLSIEALKYFPKNLKSKILLELKKLKNSKKTYTKNFDEHIKSQVGETLTKMFFKNYPEKIWGIDTKKMTAEWALKEKI